MRHTPLFFIITTLIVFAVLLPFARAASAPQLVITWKATNYAPSNYIGKLLPTPGTPITISVGETVDGKFVDISKARIAWYKDSVQFAIGDGLTSTSFRAESVDMGFHIIRVTVTIGETKSEQSIRIPVVEPTLVLEVPYPDKIVPGNSTIKVTSVPYFFNANSIKDLVFSWAIGDIKKNTGNDNILSINIGAPFTNTDRVMTIRSYIQNKKDIFQIVKLLTEIYIQ